MSNVIEIKIKGGDTSVKWLDEKGDENSIKKSGLWNKELKSYMNRLTGMVATHLNVPRDRVYGTGVTTGTDSEGDDWYTIYGTLYSGDVLKNEISAKKLVFKFNFFPARFDNGIPYDEYDRLIKEENVNRPEDFPQYITKEERDFLNELLDCAFKYAMGDEEEEKDLFSEPDEEDEE